MESTGEITSSDATIEVEEPRVPITMTDGNEWWFSRDELRQFVPPFTEDEIDKLFAENL